VERSWWGIGEGPGTGGRGREGGRDGGGLGDDIGEGGIKVGGEGNDSRIRGTGRRGVAMEVKKMERQKQGLMVIRDY